MKDRLKSEHLNQSESKKMEIAKAVSSIIGDAIKCDEKFSTKAAKVITRRCTDMWLSRHGEKERFHLTGLAWEVTLRIAVAYGWQPLGTVNRGSLCWDGSYLYGEDQIVSSKDAINFADALSKSLADRFQKLRETDLRVVLVKPKGSARFVKRVMLYAKRGSFNIDAQRLRDFCMVVKNRSQNGSDTLH